MNELWYRGYKTIGVPIQIAKRIADEIRKNKLGYVMQRICVEPSKSRGEFYFFIGIQSHQIGELPPEVKQFETWLDLNRISVFPGSELVTSDELTRSWLKREIDIMYTRQISTSEIFHEVISENPFDLSAIPHPDETYRQAYNHLLYWLSANGEGSWQSFRNACVQLSLDQQDEPRHIFRRLRLLGHIEYLDNGQRWAVCPSCLVSIQSLENNNNYFLAGGRSTNMIETLVNVRESAQAGRGGPDIIQVSYFSEQEVQSVIAEMKKKNESIELVGQVSMRLGKALPSLLGWEKTMLKPITIATERYKINQWDGKDFSNWVDKPVDIGWYQLEERDVNNQIRKFYYFYDAERKTWLQGDYYGLRFLANWYLGANVNLVHHKQYHMLLVPSYQHLPDLYERALVLASGELPSMLGDCQLYKNIPIQLAELLCEKLNAELEIKAQ